MAKKKKVSKKKVKKSASKTRLALKKKSSAKKIRKAKPVRKAAAKKKPVPKRKKPAAAVARPVKPKVPAATAGPLPGAPGTASKPVTPAGGAVPAPGIPAAPLMPWREPLPGEIPIGQVDDYLSHLEVILTKLVNPLAVGDPLHIRGNTTDVQVTVKSMQINHLPVSQADTGQEVGIQISEKVRKHDYIYKILSA